MFIGLQFPFHFDPVLLKEDLALVHTDEWAPHYNERDYGGDWRGSALRSTTGSARHLVACPQPYKDTPLMERCAYFRHVLSHFQCPLKSVRLLSLAPQSFILEHADKALGYAEGEIRIHIPIHTSRAVEFYVARERVLLEEGHAYYVDVSLPHRVNNWGAAERIHLVIDADVNEWVHALFRKGLEIPRASVPPRGFDAFRNLMRDDEQLQDALGGIADAAIFVTSAVQLGRAHGFQFTEPDVKAALQSPVVKFPARRLERPDNLRGWTPVNLDVREGEAWIEWAHVPVAAPFSLLTRQEFPLRTLEVAAPSEFIFQMPSHSVAGLALDRILQANFSPAEKLHSLRAILSAFAHEPDRSVTLDAWQVEHLPLLLTAFPDTPWTFIPPSPDAAPDRHVPGLDYRAGDWLASLLKQISETAHTFRTITAPIAHDVRRA